MLDAWFDPAPAVVEYLRDHAAWLARSSPPTHAEGLVRAIAAHRGLDPASIAVGAGSSDLIFRGLPKLWSADRKTVLLDPTYGEYRHVVTHVLGGEICEISEDDAVPEAGLVVLVNPNNPTGTYRDWSELILSLPTSTQVLIDETYLNYVADGVSLELTAAERPNVVVLKSLSKVFALSGMRVAYLVGHPDRVAEIRRWTPPWPVSMPAHMAAMLALDSLDYYQARWKESGVLRLELATQLGAATRWPVQYGHINAILTQPDRSSADVARDLRDLGVFVRDMSGVSERLKNTIRITVRSADENRRIVKAISRCR